MKLHYLLLFSLFLLTATCSKYNEPPPYSPPAIFRCKVDGVEWEAYDYQNGGLIDIGIGGSSPTNLQYYSDTKGFELGANNKTEDLVINQSIGLYSRIEQIGENVLKYRSNAFIDSNELSGCEYHELDTFAIRKLLILEIDTIDRRMKGNFEFSAINDCNDTVRITEGFFDLSF